jgi:hypothetical protein
MNLRGGYDLRLGVVQFVARVRSPTTSARFNVFKSGEAGYYVFDPLDDSGCSRCRAFPVKASDLRPEIRRALAHGWGNCL